MHIFGIRKFSCIYQIIREVDFFQLKRSYNPFNRRPDDGAFPEPTRRLAAGGGEAFRPTHFLPDYRTDSRFENGIW